MIAEDCRAVLTIAGAQQMFSEVLAIEEIVSQYESRVCAAQEV